MTHYVDIDDLPGGRRISYDVTGDPAGFPVFLLHGTPGSRVGPRPRGVILHRRGIRLIAYDRPGYGESTRQKDRRVADAAIDILHIARDLEIRHFAVVGRSGGGPHALACAALLPEMVTSAAAMVTLAPRDAVDLEWNAGMTRANVEEFGMAHGNERALLTRLRDRMSQVRRDPSAMLPAIDSGLGQADRRVIGDGGIRDKLLDTYRMAFNADLWGHFDDVRALADPRGWGVQLKEIRVPLILWHGGQDAFVPKEHTEWIARQIADPTPRVVIEPQAAHFSAIEALPDVLAWVAEQAEAVGADPKSSDPVATKALIAELTARRAG